MAMERGPFIGDSPIKTSIRRGFSIAMFDYQRVDTLAMTDVVSPSIPLAEAAPELRCSAWCREQREQVRYHAPQ